MVWKVFMILRKRTALSVVALLLASSAICWAHADYAVGLTGIPKDGIIEGQGSLG